MAFVGSFFVLALRDRFGISLNKGLIIDRMKQGGDYGPEHNSSRLSWSLLQALSGMTVLNTPPLCTLCIHVQFSCVCVRVRACDCVCARCCSRRPRWIVTVCVCSSLPCVTNLARCLWVLCLLVNRLVFTTLNGASLDSSCFVMFRCLTLRPLGAVYWRLVHTHHGAHPRISDRGSANRVKIDATRSRCPC